MWEFEIVYKKAREHRKIYGYTAGNAFRRSGLDRGDWIRIQSRKMEDEKA